MRGRKQDKETGKGEARKGRGKNMRGRPGELKQEKGNEDSRRMREGIKRGVENGRYKE